MLRRPPVRYLACLFAIFVSALPPAAALPKHEKNVWNYDGGVLLDTDGMIPGGACFRVKGRVDAPDFFENLRREDTTSGSLFRRGNNIVTEFPRELQLSVTIYDMPCEIGLRPAAPRVYLTDAVMRSLSLSFYWKHELDMRAARGIVMKSYEVGEIPNEVLISSGDEPRRFAWLFKFAVPSDGVPLTDSLVLILRTPDHHLAARTAARL